MDFTVSKAFLNCEYYGKYFNSSSCFINSLFYRYLFPLLPLYIPLALSSIPFELLPPIPDLQVYNPPPSIITVGESFNIFLVCKSIYRDKCLIHKVSLS